MNPENGDYSCYGSVCSPTFVISIENMLYGYKKNTFWLLAATYECRSNKIIYISAVSQTDTDKYGFGLVHIKLGLATVELFFKSHYIYLWISSEVYMDCSVLFQ